MAALAATELKTADTTTAALAMGWFEAYGASRLGTVLVDAGAASTVLLVTAKPEEASVM